MHPEDVTTPRRRSSRLSGPEENDVDKPVVATLVPPRKTFALKKIVPRKTQVAELNKENDERLSNVPEKRPRPSTPAAEKKTKVSTPSSGKKGKPSTPSSAKQAKVSIAPSPSPEKRPKLSTPAPTKKSTPAPTKKSTPSSQMKSKASTTPSSEKTPKIPSPAPEKKSTPSSLRKAKVSTSATPSSGKKPMVSTPAPLGDTPVPRPTRTRTPTILSPILPPQDQDNQTQAPRSPPRSSRNRPTHSDEAWSQKVRRSYSRLSGGEASFSSPLQDHHPPQGSSSPAPPTRRETLFGFEKMATPKVMRPASANVSAAPQGTSSMCGVTAVLNLSGEAEDSLSGEPVPDPNIPGVAINKKQPRKKRAQPITMSELDTLAALMNAEFAEAESFELVVE